ncbi:spore germination protein [Bacillus pinisoli]|uniref:spore germination protein n=1 Tax=Bacillus pinisoli TaxID=2901866 RepID=UPI001FF42281|nr:spore germination protein [Bacillus pinisoli]
MFNLILGPVIFNSNEGIITGATQNASPTSTGKTITGSGSFNTGFSVATNNGISASSTIDPDTVDSTTTEAI